MYVPFAGISNAVYIAHGLGLWHMQALLQTRQPRLQLFQGHEQSANQIAHSLPLLLGGCSCSLFGWKFFLALRMVAVTTLENCG